jgi:hypothetical protein
MSNPEIRAIKVLLDELEQEFKSCLTRGIILTQRDSKVIRCSDNFVRLTQTYDNAGEKVE